MPPELDPAEANEAPDDLRGQLAAAFESADTGGAAPPVQAAPPAPGAAEPKPAVAVPAGRDEHGRFAPKPKDDTAPAQAGAPTAKDPAAAVDPGAAPVARVPAAWKAEHKQAFTTLAPDLQAEILRREDDISRGFTEIEQRGQRYKALDDVLAPRREKLALSGISDVQAVQQLFAAQDYLERDPVAGVKYLMQSYGVRPEHLGASAAQPGQQPGDDPRISGLMQELHSLKSGMAQQRQTETNQLQQQHISQVQAFAESPDHPYFNEVAAHMTALLQSGVTADLKDAYDQACFANPQVRTRVLAEQARAAEADRLKSERAKADQARMASGSITGAPGLGSAHGGAPPAKDLRGALSDAWDAHA